AGGRTGLHRLGAVGRGAAGHRQLQDRRPAGVLPEPRAVVLTLAGEHAAMAQDPGAAAPPDATLCQSCGACCAYSREWPRFTLDDEAEIARIPRELVADDGTGMKCAGERCTALAGEVGAWTACTIYDV